MAPVAPVAGIPNRSYWPGVGKSWLSHTSTVFEHLRGKETNPVKPPGRSLRAVEAEWQNLIFITGNARAAKAHQQVVVGRNESNFNCISRHQQGKSSPFADFRPWVSSARLPQDLEDCGATLTIMCADIDQ